MDVLTIKLTLRLPFYSWILNPRHEYQLSDIPFKTKTFTFLVIKYDESEQYMDIEITWDQQNFGNSNLQVDKAKIIETGIDFLNYLIYHSRTLDHESEQMTFVSPRNMQEVSLSINNISSEQIRLTFHAPQEFIDLISYANHFPETYDVFTDLLRDEELGVLDINLVVDACHAIYESRYSEAVINCLTGIEARTFPLLTKWLMEAFLNKNEKAAENSLIEMTFSNKMEILFGTIYPKTLGAKSKLLEELKGINKLRNEIIHKGRRATKNEATMCLKITSEFLMIVIYDHDDDEMFSA